MNERDALDACRAYRIERSLRRATGTIGSEAGHHAGSSVEFHDYRAYQPGDDPRRIDWAVYGRSDELTVRLYREEIHPRVDIVLDASRSMALRDGRKPDLARELAAFAWHSARLQGSATRLHVVGEAPATCEDPARIELGAARCALFQDPASCTRSLRRGGLRIAISDFMTDLPMHGVIRELASGAAQLVVLVTIGPWEANPTLDGAFALQDIETGRDAAMQVGARTLARYRERLARLHQDLQRSCRAVSARVAIVVCDSALHDVLRRDLLPAGVVTPV
jgi:uncharacterized protein (DUF58 family)